MCTIHIHLKVYLLILCDLCSYKYVYIFAVFVFMYNTAQVKLYTDVSVHACVSMFTCKTKKFACTYTVACNFGMCTIASDHT